jgi:hypothetical protein
MQEHNMMNCRSSHKNTGDDNEIGKDVKKKTGQATKINAYKVGLELNGQIIVSVDESLLTVSMS